MQLLRYAFGAKGLVGQFKAAACGEHWVSDDEGLIAEVGGGQVFHFDAHALMLLIEIIAVCRHKGVACMVEDVEEALMEGQTGAKHGGQDDFVVGCVSLSFGQGRLYGLL